METKCESIPALFRKEHSVEICYDVSFSAFSSDGEVGIMLEPGEADIDVKSDEIAFLFGSNKSEFLFRPKFGLYFKIGFEADEEAAVSKLYNATMGVYKNCSLVKDVRFCVPVYRDALAMIPLDEHKEDVADDTGKEEVIVDPPPIKWLLSDEESEKEIEKEVGAHLEATEESYSEIKDEVDKEVERYNGKVLVRYRPGNARLYSYDVIEIKHRLLVIVYGELKGDWLADEESFNGERPLWFSESDHRVSPVFQAMQCHDFFRRELPTANIDSLVVLPKGCVVINDEEMQETWRKNCGTEMVRTTQIDETTIQTLQEYLVAQPAEDNKVSELDEVELTGIATRFAMNPDNWINEE